MKCDHLMFVNGSSVQNSEWCPVCLRKEREEARAKLAEVEREYDVERKRLYRQAVDAEAKLAEVTRTRDTTVELHGIQCKLTASAEAKLARAVEAMKPRLRKGHYDTCSYALARGHECDCGYQDTYRLLADLGLLADLAKPERT